MLEKYIPYNLVNFYLVWTNNNIQTYADGRVVITPTENSKYISNTEFPATLTSYTVSTVECGEIKLIREKGDEVKDCNIEIIKAEIVNAPIGYNDTQVDVVYSVQKQLEYKSGNIETLNENFITSFTWDNLSETTKTFTITADTDCGSATKDIVAYRQDKSKTFDHYECELTATQTSATINWNELSYTFKYVEKQTIVYSDGTKGSTTTYNKTLTVSFDDINDDTEKEKTKNQEISNDCGTLTFSLIQGKKPSHDVKCSYVITIDDPINNYKKINWDETEYTIKYTITYTSNDGYTTEETKIPSSVTQNFDKNETKSSKTYEVEINGDNDCDGESVKVTFDQCFKPYIDLVWESNNNTSVTVDAQSGEEKLIAKLHTCDGDETLSIVGEEPKPKENPCSAYTLQVSSTSTGSWSTAATITFPQSGGTQTAYVKSTDSDGKNTNIILDKIEGDKSTQVYTNAQSTGVSISTSSNITTGKKEWSLIYRQVDCSDNKIKINCIQNSLNYPSVQFDLYGSDANGNIGGGIGVSNGIPGELVKGAVEANWLICGEATLSNNKTIGLQSEKWVTYGLASHPTQTSDYGCASWTFNNGDNRRTITMKTTDQVESGLNITSWGLTQIQVEIPYYGNSRLAWETVNLDMKGKTKVNCTMKLQNKEGYISYKAS